MGVPSEEPLTLFTANPVDRFPSRLLTNMAFFHSKLYFTLSIVLSATAASLTSQIKNVTDCSCGYYDRTTHNFFTESVIVYFNETDSLPVDIFVPQHYENSHEKGWNTVYRQGASVSKVRVGKDLFNDASNTSLELFVEPHTPDHLVVGGGIETVRKDIFYGSFRMLMRSPTLLGSSLSMTLSWNDTQGIATNLQSTNSYYTAWVSTLSGDEFPDRTLGVNYSVLSNSSNQIFPWDYTEYRVDWTPNQVSWTIGGKLFRQINQTSDDKFPQTPVPLILKHWSVGNFFSMQGPPSERSVANVGWVRLFFNSSLSTVQDHQDFAMRCQLKYACAMDDTTLRGASLYDPAATLKWKQLQKPRGNKEAPTIILIICGTMSFLLITNALARRVPWKKYLISHATQEMLKEKAPHPEYSQSVGLTSAEATFTYTPLVSRAASYYISPASTVPGTPRPLSEGVSSEITSIYLMGISQEEDFVKSEKRKSARIHWRDYNAGLRDLQLGSASGHLRSTTGSINEDIGDSTRNPDAASGKLKEPSVNVVAPTLHISEGPSGEAVRTDILGHCECPPESNVANPSNTKPPRIVTSKQATSSNLPSKKEHIDYLAGLVAFSALLVTAIQFCLTFSPGAINPEANVHYESETWTRLTIDSYFLNLIWFGPFIMTSTRFLVSNYLKNGDLSNVAEKIVGRPFRLLAPILAIAMLEYFFMDSGATAWLEYLPSVTWSTWPFTTVPTNFGTFLSEILELAYLIPNAAPQITFNYCTGVLWTIPIQLQGCWVTLLAVIVVREIKRPWKRAGFYCFCILMHWYALSWGSYFYLAILLTDLEITYKYRKWLHVHKMAYYPVILLCVVLCFGGLSLDMATQWTRVNYAANEYGIHPDISTGLPIMFTENAGYPQYYVPKANGIVFALGLQGLVELSPFVQKLCSLKFFLYLFPHIFTIYLIHGFIFWSIGSTICVFLTTRAFPYWLNILTVAICCYAALFVSLPLLTPIVETFGKHIPANIWQFAHEKPAPRRSTLFPFPNDFLFVRNSEQGEQRIEDAVSLKPQSPFRRFITSIARIIHPRFGRQALDAASSCAMSISESVGGPTPRNVGWRTGRLSGNVEVLRRNNSSAKDKRRANGETEPEEFKE